MRVSQAEEQVASLASFTKTAQILCLSSHHSKVIDSLFCTKKPRLKTVVEGVAAQALLLRSEAFHLQGNTLSRKRI